MLKWRVATFFITLQFNHIYSVCGKSKVSFITFFHSTKTLYHWYISYPFW